MSFDPKAIGGLFELSRDAVLGVEGGSILFLNAAAAGLFHAKPGDPAEDHIPSYILNDPAEQFVASLRLDDRPGYASAARSGDFLLLSIILPPEGDRVPPVLSGAVRELAGALMATRLAVDVLTKSLSGDSDEKLRTHSAILYQSYYRMKRLCDHIAKADSLQRGLQPFHPRVVALDRMCGELCGSVNHFLASTGTAVEFVAEPGKYNTLADQSLVETLLLNAITNSIAHLPPEKPDKRILLRLSRRGDRILLAVDDNGTGMTPESLPPLLHTDASPLPDAASGTGLGLMVSRGIAELHGGALILESKDGVGTKLRVSLPVRLPEESVLHSPPVTYNKDGMSDLLTELSVILDKKFYTKTLFD